MLWAQIVSLILFGVGLVAHLFMNGRVVGGKAPKPHNGAVNIVMLLVGLALQYFAGGLSHIFGTP